MKISTSALKHFVLCATATAVISTTFVTGRQSNGRPEEETNHHQQQWQQKKQQQQHTALLYNHTTNFTHNNSDLGLHNHHSLDRDGVLISPPTITEQTNSTRTPCHPDLGVLACPKAGQSCKKSETESHLNTTDDTFGWHCVGENKHNGQVSSSSRRRLFGFPPSGEFYDMCTYDLGFQYKYNSTVRFPSAWDQCACRYYDYNLPDGESTVYNDVDYCHNVNKYFCANYYDPEGFHNPSAYDACLCSLYDGKQVQGKSSDFCDELPSRYCEAYYAYGDVVGIARCLCETFGYDDWCDFEPPDGFIPVAKPTIGPRKPTRSPTRVPTVEPTREPTREPTKNPTIAPTMNPTARPTTGTPTVMPTKKPQPTNAPVPTTPPTPIPTGKPTSFPTRTMFTPKPTTDPTPKPSPKPSPEPTADPTMKPTPGPTDLPVDFIVVGDNVFHNDGLNINKLETVATTLRRQPSLSSRPGAALRFSSEPNNVFRLKTQRDDDQIEEEIHGIGV